MICSPKNNHQSPFSWRSCDPSPERTTGQLNPIFQRRGSGCGTKLKSPSIASDPDKLAALAPTQGMTQLSHCIVIRLLFKIYIEKDSFYPPLI
jgi:hypothetical protein